MVLDNALVGPNIPECVKRLRVSMGEISQHELGERLGIRPISVYRYESAATVPPLEQLWKMAELAKKAGQYKLALAFLDPIAAKFKTTPEALSELPEVKAA